MVITHHGGQCFKVSFGETTLAFDPISKTSQLKPSRFGADIALVSLSDEDFNGIEQVSAGGREPFSVTGPGEYEIKEVMIRGLLSVSHYKQKSRLNTIYLAQLEGMVLCFLGALGEKKLSQESSETIEKVDILFVPIGGEGVLTPSEAHELAVELEAKIVIPMHHTDLGKKGALAQFLKEEGAANGKPVDKLTLKRRDLEGKEGEIVVLTS